MPTGVAGILLASILAVAMSNASGSLNSLAASTVLDFSRLSGHQADPAKFLKLSRRITLVWGAVLVGFGLVSWGPLLEAGLTVAALPFGSLLGLFFLGTFDKKATAIGATVGMFTGLAVILSIWRFTAIAFTWYFFLGSAVTFFVGSLMSRILPARASERSE
jgi:Na+/proline symporter